MQLTAAHLRYLLAIYEVSRTHLDISSRGIWVAKRVQQELDAILAHFPPVSGELTGEEQWNAALAMTSALPQRLFTADYERMVEEEEAGCAAGGTI